MMSVYTLLWRPGDSGGISHVGVPVQLAEAAGLEPDKRGGDCRGDGEVARVDDPELPSLAGDRLRGVLERVVHVRAVPDQGALGPCHVARADGRVEDVRVGRGDGVEDGLVEAKVLGED